MKTGPRFKVSSERPEKPGWLVGCFGFNGLLRQYFSLSGRLPKRGRMRYERIEESKSVQTTPPAPTANTTDLL